VAGATAVLVDFHPRPEVALCDGGQALRLEELPRLVAYVAAMRAAYGTAVSLFGEASALRSATA